MAKAPLPVQLPGEFFVLEWNKLRETFILHVDDAEKSSYNLGSDVQIAMMRFRVWGLEDIGNRAIDIAREFGVAQAIPKGNRVIPIFERFAYKSRPAPEFKEDNGYAGTLPSLSALR